MRSATKRAFLAFKRGLVNSRRADQIVKKFGQRQAFSLACLVFNAFKTFMNQVRVVRRLSTKAKSNKRIELLQAAWSSLALNRFSNRQTRENLRKAIRNASRTTKAKVWEALIFYRNRQQSVRFALQESLRRRKRQMLKALSAVC